MPGFQPPPTVVDRQPDRSPSPGEPGPEKQYDRKVETRAARIAVIGVGYVGLPLALAYANQGFTVTGLDVDESKAAMLNAGQSYLDDVPSGALAEEVRSSRLTATGDVGVLQSADVIFVCVPTPCTKNKEPDTSQIRSAAESIARHLRKGTLVILRSTSYPGTTEELVRPILETSGRKVGTDVFLAFAPERVDPGRQDYTIRNTPVLVGGCDQESTRRARLVLSQVAEQVVTMSSPAAAEMAKLLENVFRNVNIALVNQLAMLCDRMGLDIWEITSAAATKPYGFLPFHPGPGVGGHCIPVDPYSPGRRGNTTSTWISSNLQLASMMTCHTSWPQRSCSRLMGIMRHLLHAFCSWELLSSGTSQTIVTPPHSGSWRFFEGGGRRFDTTIRTYRNFPSGVTSSGANP